MTESYLRSLLAPNPGPMTLDGTNTWIVGDVTRGAPVVIDPGPLHDQHLRDVLAAAGGKINSIWLTHRHLDHSEGAARLAEVAGCGVRSADPAFQVGPAALVDGDSVDLPGATLTAVSTPGHTSDSFSMVVVGDDHETRLLTGDMVLGRGTTVITHPDGNLADYLAALELMSALVTARRVVEILPGHGPRITDPAAVLQQYKEHRLQRLAQVEEALAAGAKTAAEVVAMVYADVDHSVWPAAEQSVRAQLEYLGR